jgi:hypothetical protein
MHAFIYYQLQASVYRSIIKKGKVVPLCSIEAHLGDRRYSSYSFLTSAPEGGEWSASRPGRTFPPGERAPGGLGAMYVARLTSVHEVFYSVNQVAFPAEEKTEKCECSKHLLDAQIFVFAAFAMNMIPNSANLSP